MDQDLGEESVETNQIPHEQRWGNQRVGASSKALEEILYDFVWGVAMERSHRSGKWLFWF